MLWNGLLDQKNLNSSIQLFPFLLGTESLVLERFGLQELTTSASNQEHLSESPELIEGPAAESTELQSYSAASRSSHQWPNLEERLNCAGESHADLNHDHSGGCSTVSACLKGNTIASARPAVAGCSDHDSSLSRALSRLQRNRSRGRHKQTQSLSQERGLEVSAAVSDSVVKRLCTSSYFTESEEFDVTDDKK